MVLLRAYYRSAMTLGTQGCSDIREKSGLRNLKSSGRNSTSTINYNTRWYGKELLPVWNVRIKDEQGWGPSRKGWEPGSEIVPLEAVFPRSKTVSFLDFYVCFWTHWLVFCFLLSSLHQILNANILWNHPSSPFSFHTLSVNSAHAGSQTQQPRFLSSPSTSRPPWTSPSCGEWW